MIVIKYLISLGISLVGTGLLVLLQIRHFSHLSRHPWQDIFSHRLTLVFYVLLRVLTIFSLVRQIMLANYESALYCLLALLLFELPMLVTRRLRVELSPIMEVIILLFIYAAEILGEVSSFYVLVHGWDTVLHTINGFLCAAIGFCLVDMLNRSESFSLKLSPGYLALAAFCFSMTVGVLWEFFEFTGDSLMAIDMQKDFLVQSFHTVYLDASNTNTAIPVTDIVQTTITLADGSQVVIEGGYLDLGIIDTMKDLMVNAIGALVFSITGYLAARGKGGSRVARAFIPLVKTPGDLLQEAAPKSDAPAGSEASRTEN